MLLFCCFCNKTFWHQTEGNVKWKIKYWVFTSQVGWCWVYDLHKVVGAHLSPAMEATETPLTTWETEKPKLLKKHYHLLQEVIATVGRLPGDGDLPHAAADVCSGCSWHLWAPGKRTNEGPHSIRFKYLRVINQTSKLLNKICSMLPPWQNTFIMTPPPAKCVKLRYLYGVGKNSQMTELKYWAHLNVVLMGCQSLGE